jgi:hypothetical protein
VSHEALQAIVGAALIDKKFRQALFKGSRATVIKDFDLTVEESEAVMSIKADTLERFAWHLQRWTKEAPGYTEARWRKGPPGPLQGR